VSKPLKTNTMKKLLLCVMLAAGTAAYAQVEKGDITGTANVSFQSDKAEGADDATITSLISVRGGYFFTNNIEAGASILLLTSGAGDEKITGTGFGPYVVYNFLTAGGKFLPYVGANYYSFNTGAEGVDAIGQIGGMGGFKYFLTEAVNIDTNLNYTSWLGDFSGSTIRLNIGLGINLGKLK
jgi:hypothetical protein